MLPNIVPASIGDRPAVDPCTLQAGPPAHMDDKGRVQKISTRFYYMCYKGSLQLGFLKKNRNLFIIFFFGWDNEWGVQYPHELIRYCTPIYVLCVSSYFWRFFKANLVLEKFDKNLGLGQTPALLVGPKDQVFRKIEGSPNRDPFWQNVHYFTNLRTLM